MKKSKFFIYIIILYKRREVTYEEVHKFKEDFELDFFDEILNEKDFRKIFIFAAKILLEDYEKYRIK